MLHFRRTRVVGICCALVGMVGMVGCGSDDESNSSAPAASSTGDGGAMTSAQLDAVTEAVAPYLKRPTSIGISGDPVKVEPNKKVYFIGKSVPVSQQTASAAGKAVKALGWQVKNLAIDSNPQAFQTAIKAALDDPDTDAIIALAASVPVIQKQLAEAKAKKIPVVVIQPDVEPTDGNFVAVGGPASYELTGQLLADYVLTQTRGENEVLVVNPSAIPSLTILKDALAAEWKEKCPKCKAPLVYDAPIESLGKNLPSLIVSYLQSHRDVKFIVGTTNTLLIGVPEALKAAGLQGVKGTMWAQGPETNGLIGNFVPANLGIPVQEIGWAAVDAVVRTFAKVPVDQNAAFPPRELAWFITKPELDKAGLDPKEAWPLVADYEEQFKQQWGLDQ